MSEYLIYYLLLVIISVDFAVEYILSFLNRKSSKKPIPEELEGIYDKDRYKRSQDYQAEITKFSNITSVVSFAVLFGAIFTGLFGWVDGWIAGLGYSSVVSTLLFFGVLFISNEVIAIPFSLYRNFKIEAKYDFNKMTLQTYFSDKLKNYLLTFFLGGLLLSVLVYMVELLGADFWIFFWIVLVAFMLFTNLFYTSLVLPLFNKLTPLQDGELKQSIQEYCRRVSFPLTNIFVMDGSKRSSKGNAFFSGMGRKKKVVLFDTLIEKHTTEELTAVFAHEVGHYKKKHIAQSTIFSIVLTGFMLFIFSLMALSAEVSQALGGSVGSIHLNILAFSMLYSPISSILGIIGSIISRKNEYEADAYALETYQGQPLIDGLKKMTADHLSNLTPHPAYVFVHYSHPPLRERVRALAR